MRWLAHQDEPIAAPSPALGKKLRKHGQELVKSIIAIPSFRVVSDYEIKQQEFEKRRKLGMQQQPISSSRPVNLIILRFFSCFASFSCYVKFVDELAFPIFGTASSFLLSFLHWIALYGDVADFCEFEHSATVGV